MKQPKYYLLFKASNEKPESFIQVCYDHYWDLEIALKAAEQFAQINKGIRYYILETKLLVQAAAVSVTEYE